jgi:uncharacterized integral membrane protein
VARDRDDGSPGEPDGGLADGSSRADGDRADTGPRGAAADGASEPGRRPRIRAGQVAVLFLAVLFGVFALVNSHPVRFSWLFGETVVERDAAGEVTGGVPLIVLLLLSFILGAGLGGWWTWQAGRARRRTGEGRGSRPDRDVS